VKKQLFLIVFIFTGAAFLFSDSPLTSTPFYKAYLEINIIKKAKIKGTLNLLEIAMEDLDTSLNANLVYSLVKTQGMMQNQILL